jgi:hypothetical protein
MKSSKKEKLENLANLAYPICIAATFGALEYYGIRAAMQEFELAKLPITIAYYGENNPLIWGEKAYCYLSPLAKEGLIALFAGGAIGAFIAEPIKHFLKK